MSNSSIQNVFGQFAVQINDAVKLFATEAEAQEAYSIEANGAEHRALAAGYIASRGIEGRAAAGQTKVILSFLAYADTLSTDVIVEAPVAAPVEAVEEGSRILVLLALFNNG